MKKLMTLLLVAFTQVAQSQEIIIESSKLDSAVWKRINSYLVSIGKTPMKHFEDSLTREFSYRVTRANSIRETIEHSDSVGYVSTAECIYRQTRRGMNNSLQTMVDRQEYDAIAKLIVDDWISSTSHRNLISLNTYAATTVTTVLRIDKTNHVSSVTASWHTVDDPDVWANKTNYVFKP